MAGQSSSIETRDFAVPSFVNNSSSRGSQSSSSNSTPTQEFSASVLEKALTHQDQSRGRPRYKRRQPSQRYFTPPSRIQSPARPDFVLEVETAPQDPDIFADAETDYFSSTDKVDGPRAFRRHFFDALASIDQVSNNHDGAQSIDAKLASARS